ncbi:hypothetical protein EYF80_055223 [Liparis tanakae]|uniref:Uncharacterized protein n=1 Tax=Liparis tanakae TaxID=230148 RepID=A0A4Z2F091_9TELE|nr:hypothetical protein EYF80_055223 [Liparis tanakae]
MEETELTSWPPVSRLGVGCGVWGVWGLGKGQPVCGSIFTSQPSGSGSLSAWPGVRVGDCVFMSLRRL